MILQNRVSLPNVIKGVVCRCNMNVNNVDTVQINVNVKVSRRFQVIPKISINQYVLNK